MEKPQIQILEGLRSNSNSGSIEGIIRYLYSLCSRPVRGIIRKKGGTPGEADDALQDTMIKLLQLAIQPDFQWPSYELGPYDESGRVIEFAKSLAAQIWEVRSKKSGKHVPEYHPTELIPQTILQFVKTQNLWEDKEYQYLPEKEQVVPDHLGRLKYVIEQLNHEDKRNTFLENILSTQQTDSEFDRLLNKVISQAFEAGRAYKMEQMGNIGRAQLIENADAHARMIAPKVRQIINNGASTLEELANELNQAGITSKNGNDWHQSTVKLLLERLNKLEPDRPINLNKDAFQSKISSAIEQVQQAGANNFLAIANALNDQNITTKNGKKWYAGTIKQLIEKIEKSKESGDTLIR